MKQKTRQLWDKQNQHPGDRQRLFQAVGGVFQIESVFYPGSYVDLAPSFVFPAVTYVDLDKRAAAFFADTEGLNELIDEHASSNHPREFVFIHQDYQQPLALDTEAFDLLISLYAGFVSEYCSQHLRIGGVLLVNPSHGDAALASIDPRFELCGVVLHRSGAYRVSTDALDSYFEPKKPITITRSAVLQLGRGIGYTRSAFAYLFRRVS
ncbi:MAG: hypothetical protein HKN07_02990 [Acidimicrobiia bacterium]|nr:hypothetical protein [Acidimicrobiia bacterium]